jgi:hypothetical protein
MKHAKPIFMIFIMALICCSYSIVQPSSAVIVQPSSAAIVQPSSAVIVQPSSGIGVKGTISNGVPGILGIINNGASVYPAGEVSNAKVYVGGITGANIWRREFICNSMSACGMYPYGQRDNGDGAMVNLGGVKSGATVSGIDGSAVRIVSMAKAKT